MDSLERIVDRAVLQRIVDCNGNLTHAATSLAISSRTLQRRLVAIGLNIPVGTDKDLVARRMKEISWYLNAQTP